MPSGEQDKPAGSSANPGYPTRRQWLAGLAAAGLAAGAVGLSGCAPLWENIRPQGLQTLEPANSPEPGPVAVPEIRIPTGTVDPFDPGPDVRLQGDMLIERP